MSSASSDAGVASQEPKASIFVIDDDAKTRQMIAGILQGAGYRVQMATSDSRALAELEHEPKPDLLVVGLARRRADWHVYSGKDGASAFAAVPVLAVREASALDADAFLPAPFEGKDLLRAVELFLVVAADITLGAQGMVVDVGAVLEVSLLLASRELADRARVTCEFDRQLRARVNPEQLCLIFLNLLLNAATSIEPGGADVNGIRVAGWRTAEGRTVIEISDTGKGMGSEQLARVFESPVRRHVRAGRGLSLARSQYIVKAAGGSITVKSTLGGGASFRVELPTAES